MKSSSQGICAPKLTGIWGPHRTWQKSRSNSSPTLPVDHVASLRTSSCGRCTIRRHGGCWHYRGAGSRPVDKRGSSTPMDRSWFAQRRRTPAWAVGDGLRHWQPGLRRRRLRAATGRVGGSPGSAQDAASSARRRPSTSRRSLAAHGLEEAGRCGGAVVGEEERGEAGHPGDVRRGAGRHDDAVGSGSRTDAGLTPCPAEGDVAEGGAGPVDDDGTTGPRHQFWSHRSMCTRRSPVVSTSDSAATRVGSAPSSQRWSTRPVASSSVGSATNAAQCVPRSWGSKPGGGVTASSWSSTSDNRCASCSTSGMPQRAVDRSSSSSTAGWPSSPGE